MCLPALMPEDRFSCLLTGVREASSSILHSVGKDALYTFAACVPAAAVSGLAAYLTKQPLLFPSLGPTAFLFFEQPMARIASPRNSLIGHAVVILAGFLSPAVFGLSSNPSILIEGVTLVRVGATALSLALTGAVLLVLRASHPPSGATGCSL